MHNKTPRIVLSMLSMAVMSLGPAAVLAAPAPPPEAAPPPSASPPASPPAQPPAPAPTPSQPPATAPAQPPATAPAQPSEPPASSESPAGEAQPSEPPAQEPPGNETQPSEPPAETSPDAEATAEPPTVETPQEPVYRVAEDAWQALLEKQVVVQVDDLNEVRGKLVAVTGTAVVVLGADGQVNTVQKADAAALREDEPTEESAEASAEPEPTTPAAPEPAPEDETRKSPKLGVFTSQGVAYAHWRTQDYRAGSIAYAIDVGAGYNFRDNLGIYGVLGGHLGARLVERTIKGRTGHFGAMLRYRSKKRAVVMGGLALAWSRLEEPTQRVKEVGVAVPLKAMGQFDLGKDFYLAVGLGYQPSFFSRGRIANALSLELTFARW